MPNLTADSYTHCPRCHSENLIRQTGGDEPTRHYGRLKCGDCNKHIQWLKDPSVTLETEARTLTIREIIFNHRDKLTAWDMSFLQNVNGRRFLTEDQKKHLNLIGLKCLGMQICIDPTVGRGVESS